MLFVIYKGKQEAMKAFKKKYPGKKAYFIEYGDYQKNHLKEFLLRDNIHSKNSIKN